MQNNSLDNNDDNIDDNMHDIDKFCKKEVQDTIKEIYLELDFQRLEKGIERLEEKTKEVLKNTENYIEALKIRKGFYKG